MAQVHRHLGIADYEYSALASGKDLNSLFNHFYPTFEERSGWRMDGDYEEISDRLRRMLEDFFRPFDALLFDLLGKDDFSWTASVPGRPTA